MASTSTDLSDPAGDNVVRPRPRPRKALVSQLSQISNVSNGSNGSALELPGNGHVTGSTRWVG